MTGEKLRARAYPLYLAGALLAAALVAYSQTYAFAWDEGFHIVAAQLIKAGRRPYLDWMFPQTPLNAYWNAFWLRMAGESWRTTHAVAALETAIAALLTGIFALKKFPVARWRLAAAIFCMVLVGTNLLVIEFGTLAQSYGFSLLATVVAFWFTTMTVDRATAVLPFAAGLFSGIAAGGSLLTAPVAPSLLVWMLLCNRAGSRWWKLAVFVGGCVVAWIPILRLFAMGPRQTWFSIVQYHLYYRQVEWSGALRHDLETAAGLFNSLQAVLLVLLAVGGTLFVYRRSGWERARKQEFYLCVLLTVALVVHVSSAHPTFARYYLFTTPFLSYLAAAGIYFAGARLWSAERPWLPVAMVCVIMTLSAAKSLYDIRDEMSFQDMEEVAQKVGQVAPADKSLVADEVIFFLLHRPPPPGMAVRDSNKLNLPPKQAALLHILPHAELQKRVQSGGYYAVEFCDDDAWFDADHLTPVFKNHAEVGDCHVFWDPRPPAPK